MIRRIKVILLILTTILAFSTIISQISYSAVEMSDMGWESQITTMDSKAGKEEGYGKDVDTGKVDNLMGTIISMVRVIAVGVAIIMISVLAMKYLTAAPGDKADIKKHAVIYIVGAVILFGASGILGIIIEFSDNIK